MAKNKNSSTGEESSPDSGESSLTQQNPLATDETSETDSNEEEAIPNEGREIPPDEDGSQDYGKIRTTKPYKESNMKKVVSGQDASEADSSGPVPLHDLQGDEEEDHGIPRNEGAGGEVGAMGDESKEATEHRGQGYAAREKTPNENDLKKINSGEGTGSGGVLGDAEDVGEDLA